MANKKFVALTGEISKTTETEAGILTPNSLKTNNITLVYDSEVSYVKNNIVEYDGKLYKANGTIPKRKTVAAGTSDSDWALVAGGGLEEWKQTQAYKKGDVVWTGDKIYKANGAIAASSIIKVGSYTDSDASWTLLSTSGSVGGEYGEVVRPESAGNLLLTSGTPVTVITFTLPSAGVWEVIGIVRSSQNAQDANTGAAAAFYDPNGNLVANSYFKSNYIFNSGALNIATQASGTGVSRITTTGPATYTLKAFRDGNAGTALIQSDGNGYTKVSYKKISGFVPATGAVTSYRSATLSTTLVGGGSVSQDMTTVSNSVGNLPLSGTGVWTLTAGVTYELFAAITYDALGTNSYSGDNFAVFVDATTNTQLTGQYGASQIATLYAVRGLSRSNLTRFTYTPTTNQTVKFRVTFQNNPGFLEAQTYVAQIGTTNASGFVGSVTNSWNIANTYPSGTIVVKDGMLYQANDLVPAGQTFTISDSGATWKQIGFGSVNSEFGEAVPAGQTNLAISSAAPQFADVVSFTLPSAGTWEVSYSLRGKVSVAAAYVSGFITDSSNNLVANSAALCMFIGIGGANYQGTASQTVRITTTGSATYKLRAKASGDTDIAYVTGADDVNGTSKVVWKKISGLIPTNATTAVSNVLKITNTSAQVGGSGSADTSYATVGTGGRMAFVAGDAVITSTGFTVGTNTITINTAGTYRFTADYSATDNGISTTSIALQMGVNGTAIGNFKSSTAIVSSSMQVTVYELVNLNAGDIVDFRMFNGSTNEVVTTAPRITILGEQVGTTNTSAFTGMLSNSWNIVNTYPSGTIVVKDGALYQANETINGGTAFTIGTTGGTWKLLASSLSSFTEALTITGSTSNPTKATTRQVDYIDLVDDGSGWCGVNFEYAAASNTGSLTGSGAYLFTLPNGYQFNATTHLLDNVTTSLTAARMNRIIPGSNGIASTDGNTVTTVIVPYDATRFKIITMTQVSGTGNSALGTVSHTYFNTLSTNHLLQGSFRFKKA